MASTIHKIQFPDDGDLANAESVNNALRELSDLISVQNHLPIRVARLGQSGSSYSRASVWNPVLGFWYLGAGGGSFAARYLPVGARKRLAEYQHRLNSTPELEDYFPEAPGEWQDVPTGAGGIPNLSNGVRDMLCRTDGSMIAVGGTGLISTGDSSGVWTTRTPAGGFAGTFYGVAWSGAVFVAVGSGGTVQTSPDGVTWTARAFDGSFLNPQSVTWTGTLFVAVGSTGAGAAKIQTSPDGVTWTDVAISGLTLLNKVRVGTIVTAPSPTYVFAVGQATSVTAGYAVSADGGATWTAVAFPTGEGIETFEGLAYCYNSDLFCAVGHYYAGHPRENDGVAVFGHPQRAAWYLADDPQWVGCSVNARFYSVSCDGTRFLLSGEDQRVAITSPAAGRRVA